MWFWFDNTTALSAVIHDYTRSPHLAKMTNEIHLQFARLQITVWFEWVPSECNIADIPSRPEGQEEYAFYKKEGISRWQGHMIFPSTDLVKSPELDMDKWSPTA